MLGTLTARRGGTARGARLIRCIAGLGTLWLAAVCGGGTAGKAQSISVDLELLLAVDASSSVSAEEFALQTGGLAGAFRDPRVVAAIRSLGDLGVAVALVQWSDSRKQFLAIDWSYVRDEEGAQALADRIEGMPRFLVGGGTAIGGALEYSIRQFELNDIAGRRQVIDVSGDGRTNQGAQPRDQRDIAVARGITINGLAILNEDPTVDSYYATNVIGGTGAFVMTANDYAAYADAILAKLIKEISGVPIARVSPDRRTQLARGAACRSGPRSPQDAARACKVARDTLNPGSR